MYLDLWFRLCSTFGLISMRDALEDEQSYPGLFDFVGNFDE